MIHNLVRMRLNPLFLCAYHWRSFMYMAKRPKDGLLLIFNPQWSICPYLTHANPSYLLLFPAASFICSTYPSQSLNLFSVYFCVSSSIYLLPCKFQLNDFLIILLTYFFSVCVLLLSSVFVHDRNFNEQKDVGSIFLFVY